MRKTFIQKATVITLIAVLFLSGCASSTMINSTPSGAKVFINGESVGTTPYLYTDTKILGTLVNVDLLKDGYEPLYTSFRRTEEFNVGTFIGGCFIWPIWLWTMDYKQTHNYELVPTSALNNNDNLNQPQTSANSKVQRLKDLKQLFDEKVINQEEYEKQKQKILDEI